MPLTAALIEVFGLAPALVIADQALKAADVQIVGVEGNAGQDSLIKLVGNLANVERAIEAANAIAAQMGAKFTACILRQFEEPARAKMIYTAQEYSPITCGYLHMLPQDGGAASAPVPGTIPGAGAVPVVNPNSTSTATTPIPSTSKRGSTMQAIGLLETQGLSAVIEGADAMLKAANVEVVGKEKIGAAHVTVMIRGDVAAVKAAIDAGKAAAEKVGKVVAAIVIARPHEGLVKLLPA